MILAPRLAVLKKKHEMKPQAMREFLGFLVAAMWWAKMITTSLRLHWMGMGLGYITIPY